MVAMVPIATMPTGGNAGFIKNGNPPRSDAAESLKKIKELLDQGPFISQEVYDQKKKGNPGLGKYETVPRFNG